MVSWLLRRWFVECSLRVRMMMMIMEKKAHLTSTKWEYKQTPCSRALGIYLYAREEEEDNNNIIIVVVVQTKG